MEKTLLSLIAIIALTGCDAAETNQPVRVKADSWANVPGGVVVRRFTNNVPVRREELYSNAGAITNYVVEYREQKFIQAFQAVRWLNESNTLETVEFPLIQPRLLSETLRTNVVTR